MASLPRISCRGYDFTPRSPVSDIEYCIDPFMHAKGCDVFILQNDKPAKVFTVDPSIRFPIDRDLVIVASTHTSKVVSALSGLIFAGIGAYLFGVKRNDHFSLASAVVTVIFAVTYSYFNSRCRRASFDIANKVISAELQKSTSDKQELFFNPSDYSGSFGPFILYTTHFYI
ncbi:MAG TPA: hypothetical protein VHK67_03185 [Rhabdochlamydiaceae bacterium]|jgi:hypothetical protein|nr:hypothetical protein [Rhabdochlamydiaceae bacterium]